MYLGVTSESYGAALDSGALTLADWLRLCAEELGLSAVELEDRHVGAPTAAWLAEVREAAARHRPGAASRWSTRGRSRATGPCPAPFATCGRCWRDDPGYHRGR